MMKFRQAYFFLLRSDFALLSAGLPRPNISILGEGNVRQAEAEECLPAREDLLESLR